MIYLIIITFGKGLWCSQTTSEQVKMGKTPSVSPDPRSRHDCRVSQFFLHTPMSTYLKREK